MSEPTPTYADELQFIGWSDSSRNGPRVTFALPSREALERFIGAEGKRFASVLVLVGDDEMPVPPPEPAPKLAEPKAVKADEPKGGAKAQLAGKWCKTIEFQRWCADRPRDDCPAGWDEESARAWVCAVCGVEKRRYIDHDEVAAGKFEHYIRGPYAKHLLARGIA